MRDIFHQKMIFYGAILWMLVLLVLSGPRTAAADTVDTRYPGLATDLLKSAVLAPLDNDTLLAADGFTIKQSQLMEGIQDQRPKLREQLEKNLFFLLEQEAVRQVLLSEARKAGISAKEGDDSRAIQALFEQRTKGLSVSEDEARAFYAANKEMVGGAPFEQVADGIRSIPVQVFYDAAGKEVFRHAGFFAQTEVDKQLAAMGVQQ